MKILGLLLGSAIFAQATTYCVTVVGLGGEQEYEQRFSGWSKDLEKTLKALPNTRVETLTGPQATKATIRQTLEAISKEAKSEDLLLLTLIGHGSFDGQEYKMNIPGPDVNAIELATLLDRISTARQVVVNATSASGASLHALQKTSRTVITATKTGSEKNATVFARYWVDALRDSAADVDKNETISAAEAFRFAETKTKQFYDTNKRLATEHPSLDGGDAAAQLAAGRVALFRVGATQLAANDPAKRTLLNRREELETKIDGLKLQKAAMPADEYRKQLQALLLDLAKTQAELDKE
jgi:hypothetical protein